MAYEHGIYPENIVNRLTTHETLVLNTSTGYVTFKPLYHSLMSKYVSRYGKAIIQITPTWIRRTPGAGYQPTAKKAKMTLECFNALSIAHPEYGTYVYYNDEPYTDQKKAEVKEKAPESKDSYGRIAKGIELPESFKGKKDLMNFINEEAKKVSKLL